MELFSLTKPQKSIWSMEQYYGGSVANITGSLLFEASVEVQALQDALNKTLEQCDALRIRIHLQDGEPKQYISPFMPCEFEMLRFDDQAVFEAWITALARTPFDFDGNLYKLFVFELGTQIGVVLHLHHLTADAWTLNLLANTIMKNLKGETSLRGSYTDYLLDEQAYEDSSRRAKDKAYFMSCFEKCSEPVYLSNKQTASVTANRLSITIDAAVSQGIQVFCDDNGISPYALFLNALAIYLYRIKGAQDMFIGTTVLNRAGYRAKNTPGLFINTVPVLAHIDEAASVLENLQQNAESISGVFRHQKYQYNDILKDIREQYGATNRLFDVMLNYQNAALDDGGMEARWHFCGMQGESLNIHINDRQREGLFHLDYDYQTELFSEQDITRLHGHLMNLLADIIAHSEKKPQELKLLSDEEYHRVVVEFNDTAVAYPSDKCIHQLFEEQAKRTPEIIAVIACDKTLSYRELNEQSNRIAHNLIKMGVKPADIVGLRLPRKSYLLSAIMGVLKSGAAFLPIPPDYPEDRINYILQDSNADVCLTVENIHQFLSGENASNPTVETSSDSLCYCIYTSGSTGNPKGTLLSHKNANNLCFGSGNGFSNPFISNSINRPVSITTIGFDIFIGESLFPLLNGLTVILASEEEARNQSTFASLIESRQGESIQTTPSKMSLLMSDAEKLSYLAKLKVIILGGEAVEPSIIERIKKHTNAKIYDFYGPTETTVWSAGTEITSADITIGKPIANTQIYILDRHQNPLPIGAVGELCIAGLGVGRGYLNRPELTAEKFVSNPFGNGRMYKTGDLAHWREDGNIVYVGRMDHQVKIRGLRIELGEIEAAIVACPGVKQIAVVVKTDETGRQYICAYYIGEAVDTKEVKVQLAKRLPQYMVPHFFISMERFPSTPSGKTDRKAFPAPDFANIESDAVYVPPVGPLEMALVGLMEKVLGTQRIGRDDDFFDLGGDSLKAIEFVSKANCEDVHFSLQDVFDHPTAALLSLHIAEGNHPTSQCNEDDYSAIHQLLKGNVVTDKGVAPKQSLGNVLITGATGWLGAHVLDAFLSNEQGMAYCLVRGADLADSQTRLQKTLDIYYKGRYAECDRIVLLCGDITEPIVMEAPINTIIHCAALVKHYGSYQASLAVNVLGTQNVIALAKAKGARLLHVSTTSVSGNSFDHDPDFPETVFDETSLFIGQPLKNVYVRSKFVAEAAVLRARLEGLEAAVIRVGNLANRRSDAMFQQNYSENATLTKLKAFMNLGLFPEQMLNFPLEFSPVDETAAAVIRLAQHFDNRYSVFHAYNHQRVAFSQFIKALPGAGLECHSVSTQKFVQALQKPEAEQAHEAFVAELDADGNINLKSNITVQSDFTAWYLSQAGFDWKDIDSAYITAYISYFKNIGYWEASR